ncbi:MAG TPA: biotin-dependent carboxyltransferase family protein [Verrucomicrobiae bacterium]|jgi:antagonist of KipI|nr:biotin-dependent carboxyltransferase family protein [Verrucomicrobiae bacterium]
MSLLIKDPGFATTVQDLGRFGYAHLGISPAGAADGLSFRIANMLVGNHENAAGLEMSLSGATIEFQEETTAAITGASCQIALNGVEIAHSQLVHVPIGAILQCDRMIDGARAYLAVQGGIDVPSVMGSASTHLAARFGGFQGRSLRKGDLLNLGRKNLHAARRLNLNVTSIKSEGPTRLRVTRGPQQDWFAADSFATLFSATFTVTQHSGRTGLRLAGDCVVPSKTAQLLTEGVSLGALQIPPDGQPIILFVDQQTTGGYPKIANVVAADMHRVGQLRPADKVIFEEVSIDDALQLLRQQERWLRTAFEED